MLEFIVLFTDKAAAEKFDRCHGTNGELVRCKDCKYSDVIHDTESYTMPLKCLNIRYGGVQPDWYCEHGERRESMARFPDGMVFIFKVSGPKVKDGKAFADVSVDGRELVMCKNCKWWDKDQTTDGVDGFCPIIGRWEQPDFYCAYGERRDDSEAD